MAEAVTLPVVTGRQTSGRAPADPAFETTLVVENMHCGGCIRSVEKALLALPDVIAARANLGARRVVVTTRSEQASVEMLIGALQEAGFKAARAVVKAANTESEHDRDYLRRLGVAGFAAANIMLLSVAVWSGYGEMPKSMATLFHWLSAAIALPAVAYAGKPFFSSAVQALKARRLNMDVPISLGVILATAMSLFQTIRGTEQVYFDAAVSLLFFLLIGRYLDVMMRARANSTAQNLLALQSTEATVIGDDDDVAVRMAADKVVPGMRLLVAAGERMAVDGRLESGAATIDDSLVTGESLPRQLRAGDVVYAGTINLGAPFEAKATSSAEGTLVAELARLMESAQQARGAYVRLADRAARLYAPLVHILSAGTFAGWMLLGFGWEPALTAAIAVLIITCPCALALAVPAVQVVAVGRLLRSGVVVKAPDGLERLAEVDTVVLDKTGTLTMPQPALVGSPAVDDAALAHASSLAKASRHPYSRAVVAAAAARAITVPAAKGVREVAGAGLALETPHGEIRLGSAAFCGMPEGDGAEPALWLTRPGLAPVELRFEEALRPDARASVERLSRKGFSVELLSGDRETAVAAAARATGIACYAARRRPDEKLARLAELAAEGRKVLMVGDGLNDAPALAAGHASVSPQSAADISQTAADAVLQGDRLAPLLELLSVARSAHRRALENFAIAIGYNIVFVPMAVVGLVTPLIAAIAMSASSIAVTANAMRVGLGKKETAR
jgi:Cu2+-exporting ATPase